jgi:tellurite resistance protein TerC
MTLLWLVFAVVIAASLTIDLIGHRFCKEPSIVSSLAWSGLWISLAIIFGVIVSLYEGKDAAYQFFTAYLLEKALSVDNLFVFIVIFGFFGISRKFQHRILFWGILGAIAMRAIFIFLGVALVSRFHFVLYLFGAFLIYTAIKLVFAKLEQMEPNKNIGYRLAKRFLPVCEDAELGRFFVIVNGRRMVTRMFFALVVIEVSDLVFALDSIPAVLAISSDSFVIFTSNIFAILGLRALYFLLAGVLVKLRYLNIGLSVVLAFIGGKMIASNLWQNDYISPGFSLVVVGGILVVAIIASIIADYREQDSRTRV